jgi:hypothetical protein
LEAVKKKVEEGEFRKGISRTTLHNIVREYEKEREEQKRKNIEDRKAEEKARENKKLKEVGEDCVKTGGSGGDEQCRCPHCCIRESRLYVCLNPEFGYIFPNWNIVRHVPALRYAFPSAGFPRSERHKAFRNPSFPPKHLCFDRVAECQLPS